MPKNDSIYMRCYQRLKRRFGFVSKTALDECIFSERLREGEKRFLRQMKPVQTIYIRERPEEELVEGLKGDFWDKDNKPKETVLEREKRVSKLAEGKGIDYKLLMKLLEEDES